MTQHDLPFRIEPSVVELQAALDARRASECALWMHDVSGAEWTWYVKRLSGNDTLLTGGHQGGPYMPNRFTCALFPTIAAEAGTSTTRVLDATFASHLEDRRLAVKYWMNASKRETHITGWGGRDSAMLAPESTGSLVVFAFRRAPGSDPDALSVWLCATVEEEDEVEERIGPVEPVRPRLVSPAGVDTGVENDSVPAVRCSLLRDELRPEWRGAFPSTLEVVLLSVARSRLARGSTPDARLMTRRDCEFELFKSLETHIYLDRIREGFETVELFIDYANSVTNRRKSRAGSSLALQTKQIFEEEGLACAYDRVSEGRKRPDFLFPSAEHYANAAFPAERLTMLAAKTTAKDRWRQILNEADRLPVKHLLTLQEGVTEAQFAEMRAARVVLVVPESLHRRYPASVRPHLLTLAGFIRETAARLM